MRENSSINYILCWFIINTTPEAARIVASGNACAASRTGSASSGIDRKRNQLNDGKSTTGALLRSAMRGAKKTVMIIPTLSLPRQNT